jgi:hemoglobin
LTRFGTVESIYEQIGGTAAVGATVDELYARVLGDPRLAPYFAGIDLERQRHHMRAFIAAALGGTHTYQGRDMAQAHAGLGITARDFDRVASHLAGALRTLGVPTAQLHAILARVVPLRDDIVGGDPAPVV